MLCPLIKAYCLLSNGPHFVHVQVFNHDGNLLMQAQTQLQFKASVTEPSNVDNTGMAKHIEGRPPALWLVGSSDSNHCSALHGLWTPSNTEYSVPIILRQHSSLGILQNGVCSTRNRATEPTPQLSSCQSGILPSPPLCNCMSISSWLSDIIARHTHAAPVGRQVPLEYCIGLEGTTLFPSARDGCFWRDHSGWRQLLVDLQPHILCLNTYAGLVYQLNPCTTRTSDKYPPEMYLV